MITNASRPQRLYLLKISTSMVPLPGGRTLEMVLGCYLLETGDGGHILIDSGFPADVRTLPDTEPGAKGKNVIEHLSVLGLRPQDIDILICTHFDIDHAGYHDAFQNADCVVQRAHYALAKTGHPRFAGAREHWDHPALRYRLLDGDTELLPGLTLVETSGHTTGHQSVLIRLPKTGAVLLAIDAVPLARLFSANRMASPVDENAEQARASAGKLLDIAMREHVELVIFGHDAQQWETLKVAPDFYD